LAIQRDLFRAVTVKSTIHRSGKNAFLPGGHGAVMPSFDALIILLARAGFSRCDWVWFRPVVLVSVL
jgi:hypothetical protein